MTAPDAHAQVIRQALRHDATNCRGCKAEEALDALEAERNHWREVAHAEADEVARVEHQRDEWLTPFFGSGIEWHESLTLPYTYEASDFSALVAAVHEYEARALAAEADLVAARASLADIADGRWDEKADTGQSPSDWARDRARAACPEPCEFCGDGPCVNGCDTPEESEA